MPRIGLMVAIVALSVGLSGCIHPGAPAPSPSKPMAFDLLFEMSENHLDLEMSLNQWMYELHIVQACDSPYTDGLGACDPPEPDYCLVQGRLEPCNAEPDIQTLPTAR